MAVKETIVSVAVVVAVAVFEASAGRLPSTGVARDAAAAALRLALQDLLQVVTSSHARSHFLRHVKGLLHTTHILEGRLFFAMAFPGPFPLPSFRMFKIVVEEMQRFHEFTVAQVMPKVGRKPPTLQSDRGLKATTKMANVAARDDGILLVALPTVLVMISKEQKE